jgi:hypothetical protein
MNIRPKWRKFKKYDVLLHIDEVINGFAHWQDVRPPALAA